MPLYPLTRHPLVTRAAEQLAIFLKDRNLSQSAIAAATGVPQYQVNRLLNGRTKKLTPHVAELCRYAKIDLDAATTSLLEHPRIREALTNAWDGRGQTIEVLASLIEAARPMLAKVQLREPLLGVKSPDGKK